MEYFEIMKRRKEYLETLVAGSKTFFLGYLEFSRPVEVTVERVTKTQIILSTNPTSSARKFNREDGKEIGQSSSYRASRLIDPETAAEITKQQDERQRRNNLVELIAGIDRNVARRFDTDLLQKLTDAVAAIANEQDARIDANNPEFPIKSIYSSIFGENVL